MDDFLHNLRSGKLKQPDRSGRPYNDSNYKGASRRNVMDRRKRDYDAKESFERLNAIKEVLETLSETQKRMAEAYESRTTAELRKARAMEVLAKNLYRMLNPGATDADRLFDAPLVDCEEAAQLEEDNGAVETRTEDNDEATRDATPESSPIESEAQSVDEAGETEPAEDPENTTRKLSGADRKRVFETTQKMRAQGDSWETIARHISEGGYPTVSGKGTWRGTMVKSLFEKLSSDD